ncbi:amylo-alpha-1,6-glucosidase [Microbacterium terrisoli]|uniref:amylo-alpha-1,6-glucosidase n=1 Tax=Microbacterium terrisoli TaxID=3242192 RepID=UPI002804EDCD|nr:glycogen debranching protein [Microbacterium protaetiae]
MDFTFDITEIPFSARGSWLDLSPVVGLHTVSDDIHLVTHTGGMHPVFRLVPDGVGDVAAPAVRVTPASLAWVMDGGNVEVTFAHESGVRFRGRGLGLRFVAPDELTPFTGGYLFVDPSDGAITLTSYETGRRYRFTVIAGTPTVLGEQLLGAGARSVAFGAEEGWEVLVEEIETGAVHRQVKRDFDAEVEYRHREFDEYHESIRGRAPATVASARAAYVLWSATVAPAGFVQREAILMSKHWMDKVWSWDHCFNAIALAESDPQAALDQFLLPFDHQDAVGALPDSLTHSEVLYNFVKPPIHGWAFAQLRKRSSRAFTDIELATVYDRLAAWTRFWLDHRVSPGSDLPYYQHGNDSGWDNSTMFDHARVVEAPDLAAFLLLQLDELRLLAEHLGRPALEWDVAAQSLERALFDRLWTGEHFIARSVATGEASSHSSLLTAMPIILGERLPVDVADALAASIAEHLTPWGPATEPPGSAAYEDDGYWRGPIWAPSTFLIENGLRRAGHGALADDVSRAFRAACEKSGFAENFDAVSGAGLRDRAYTWTASTYLILAADAAARGSATSSGAE